MKIINIKEILILSTSLIILLCIPTSIIRNFDEISNPNLKMESSTFSQDMLKQPIWDLIENSQLDTFELKVEIFGYKITATEINPIEYDKNGQLLITKNNEGLINLELHLDFGSYKFSNIPIRGNLVID